MTLVMTTLRSKGTILCLTFDNEEHTPEKRYHALTALIPGPDDLLQRYVTTNPKAILALLKRLKQEDLHECGTFGCVHPKKQSLKRREDAPELVDLPD